MAALAVGVDLGGTNARAAVVDRQTGAIVAVHKELHQDRAPQAIAEEVARAVRAAAAMAGVDLATVARVGVGVAGPCHGATGVVLNAPNLGWRDVAFGPMLAKELGIPVRLANDLSVAAWGEKHFGAARGRTDVALVFIGSGIGCSLILGGHLHEGARGVGGELGHVKVRPPRPTTPVRRCGCGELSCLEAYTSGANIAARVREELSAGAVSVVRDLAGGDLTRAGAQEVDRAFAQGDAYAVGLWQEVAELLGTSMANLVTLLNPERIVLGGGVILRCPELEKLVLAAFDDRVSHWAKTGFDFSRADLGDDAGVIGAAILE